MSGMLFTPFHLVEVSAWPIFASIGGLGLTFGGMIWWNEGGTAVLIFSMFLVILISFSWFSKVKNENLKGFHNSMVVKGLRMGMVLFILSEVLFFFSFFWSFFHNCWGLLSWPPLGFNSMVIDPFSMPLLNTVVLLSSGVSITWAHHSLISNKKDEATYGLMMTVLLGFYFLFLQGKEYQSLFISMKSQVYGSVFFMLTGFHGFHVTMGFILLSVCLSRHYLYHNSSGQHVGFEVSSWYWHFVDVVWLFLFYFIYWYSYPL